MKTKSQVKGLLFRLVFIQHNKTTAVKYNYNALDAFSDADACSPHFELLLQLVGDRVSPTTGEFSPTEELRGAGSQ